MFGLTLLLLAVGRPAVSPAYAVLSQPAQRVACTLTVKINAPQLNAAEWILICARPPEAPGQNEITASLAPGARAIRDLSELKRPALLARAFAKTAAQRQGYDTKLTLQATLHARFLVEGDDARGAKPPTPLLDQARQLALGVNGIVDHKNPAFRRWLEEEKLLKAPDENDVDFGRRAFVFLRDHCAYEYKSDMDRRASAVCKTGKSDCGGHSALFVATLRASGVPARVLIGRWATSSRANEKLEGLDYTKTHVKAEFYANGVGWIPVDLSSAVIGKAKDQPPHWHFGRDPGDFVCFHIDHDMKVDTIHFGVKTIDGMQSVAYYAVGGGDFDGQSTTEKWTVERKPVAGSAAGR